MFFFQLRSSTARLVNGWRSPTCLAIAYITYHVHCAVYVYRWKAFHLFVLCDKHFETNGEWTNCWAKMHFGSAANWSARKHFFIRRFLFKCVIVHHIIQENRKLFTPYIHIAWDIRIVPTRGINYPKNASRK